MELTYAEINNENIELLQRLQHEIFPESSFDRGFEMLAEKGPSFFGNVTQTYFVVFGDGEPAGMFGLYIPEGVEEHKSIWLGWYGILPSFRGKGIGKRILYDSMEKAREYTKQYGVIYFRLYTNESINGTAQPLYNREMTLKEYYRNPEIYSERMLALLRRRYPGHEDEFFKKHISNSYAIFSKSLYREEILVPWNDYPMSLINTLELEQFGKN